MAAANFLAFSVGLVFMASSLAKLLHIPDFEISEFMIKEFRRYADVFPLKHFDISIDPDFYRTLVGAVELGCASVLMYGRDPWRSFAATKLLVIMMGAVYTHIATDEADHIAVPIVLALLLLFFILRH